MGLRTLTDKPLERPTDDMNAIRWMEVNMRSMSLKFNDQAMGYFSRVLELAKKSCPESDGRVTLAKCPVGLFESDNGELCLKTQYRNNEGQIDAYIVSTGEYFWGSAPQTVESQRAQMVRPIAAKTVLELSKIAALPIGKVPPATLTYDAPADVLYCTVHNEEAAQTDRTADGALVRRRADGTIVGITVPDFFHQLYNKAKRSPTA